MADLDVRTLDDGTTIRFLAPDEGGVLGDAIRAAYGDSYDAAWVYDSAEVGARIADGRLISCVGLTATGELLGHAALSRSSAGAAVGEAGQAVTLPAARGHHLFTAIKRHLADRATADGMVGMFSEATTAHPYSERANVELGAHEAGFLLGWIPATVANNAAADRSGRQSAALFYLKLNDGHDRPLYAPDRHREITERIVTTCGLRGRVAEAEDDLELPARSTTNVTLRDDHNLAILSVDVPGADLADVAATIRADLFGRGLDALYVDLPLDRPETEVAGEALEEHGFSFAGLFPNMGVAGDVLRLQSLNAVTIDAAGIASASDHGRDLLAYVLADHERVNLG